ncbi:DUF397 domain-containing protein [Streptomyces erythrochromogenes]|uniref:DUF397 domain-containing protein n=1 Tax=Streptomyces erythrochromogenes TaxID=285574 RepID=A0ABZ1QDR1_9ACTN|nr:DUF397 domain-containing protein [Streptomyces erythrochromogenes]MCX5586086.1 DUF397 domain-containing protein [Streptomyces erythrochromogenes]
MMSTPEYDLAAATWHKSSYSAGDGGNCLEMATWRKSTHSGASASVTVPVRDSKVPDGPHLTFRGPAWKAFVTSL